MPEKNIYANIQQGRGYVGDIVVSKGGGRRGVF